MNIWYYLIMLKQNIGYYMVTYYCSIIAMGTWKANNLRRLMMTVYKSACYMHALLTLNLFS